MSELAYIGPGGRRPSRPLLRTLIGEALRRNRQGQRRTLADVARQARVSVPYLSEVERGRKEASSEVLAAVCDALRVELSDLLVEVGRELTRDAVPAPVLRLGDAELRRAEPGGAQLRLGDARRTNARRSASRSGDVVLLAA